MDTVTVIISSLAQTVRKAVLWRAIDSVLGQEDARCVPMIIINGQQYDPELRQNLERDSRLRCYYLPEGSLPKAIVEGRRRVDTNYFCFLDDDDLLMERSVASRLRRFQEDSSLDVVVGNGYRCDQVASVLEFRDEEAVRALQADPFANLIKGNWLASCAGLYRTESISGAYFEDHVKYYEWTYLAFRLALHKKIGFIAEPTYKVFSSEGSISTTDEYVKGQAGLIEKLKTLDVPQKRYRIMLDRLCRARYHELSNYYRSHNEAGQAWKYHLLSIGNTTGLKFVPYSRHLLFDSVKAFLKLPNHYKAA